MKYLIISLFILISCSEPQRNNSIIEDLNNINNLTVVTLLDNLVDESSGLVFLNNDLITFNDSGGSNSLFVIDAINGEVKRIIEITNATNNEPKVNPFSSINSSNSESDFLPKFLNFNISDFLKETNSPKVNTSAVFKQFNALTDKPYNSNFDAESLISYNDSLYVFTKNWADRKTNIYPLPKNSGTYITSKIDSIDVNGLITAAEYSDTSNTVTLLGYNSVSPFVIELTNFNNSNFSQGLISKFPLVVPENSSIQTEGLTNKNNSYYISAEDYLGNPQVLYQISKDSLLFN